MDDPPCEDCQLIFDKMYHLLAAGEAREAALQLTNDRLRLSWREDVAEEKLRADTAEAAIVSLQAERDEFKLDNKRINDTNRVMFSGIGTLQRQNAELNTLVDELREYAESLTGEKFSERCHVVLKSRAEKAETALQQQHTEAENADAMRRSLLRNVAEKQHDVEQLRAQVIDAHRRIQDWEPLKLAFQRRIDFECDRTVEVQKRLSDLQSQLQAITQEMRAKAAECLCSCHADSNLCLECCNGGAAQFADRLAAIRKGTI